MTRNAEPKKWKTAGALAAGAGLMALDWLLVRRKQVIEIEQEMPVTASEVLDLIKQVEREPDFIPLIYCVAVHERTEQYVRYTAWAAPPFPAAVHYRKWWQDSPPSIHWASEQGTLGFHHNGEITFTELSARCAVHLRSEHWLTTPGIGRLAGPALTPILRSQLRLWLNHLANELVKRRG